jgi:hypothetical protein
VYLISLSLTDLVSGYDYLRAAQQALIHKWRKPLLEGYSRQRKIFDKSSNHVKQNQINKKRISLIGIALISILLLAGVAALLISFSFDLDPAWQRTLFTISLLLCLSGIGAGLILGGILLYSPRQPSPAPPPNPLQLTSTTEIPALLANWQKSMQLDSAVEPQDVPSDEGYTGELYLVQSLAQIPVHGYILHRLVQKEGDDLDVIAVAQNGIWLFEVKYWKGSIFRNQGQWTKEKTYLGRGGIERTSVRQVSQPPELQWQRMRDDLIYTLNRQAPGLIKRYPGLTQIQGGVVFAHPDSEMFIPPGAGFSWGNLPFWLEKFQEAPSEPLFADERLVLTVVEVLLRRHQRVLRQTVKRSMLRIAEELVSLSDRRLQDIANLSSPPNQRE